MTVALRILCAMLLAITCSAQQLPQTGASAHAPQAATAAAAQGLRISGIIVNALSGQPVPAARVAIARVTQGTDRDITQSVTTGADGRFVFTGLSRGKYSLMAAARGFSLQYFEHHDPYATAVAVGPDLDSTNLVFRIEPDAAIEGIVTDDNNEPIQYAIVRLFQRSSEDGMQKTLPMNQGQTDDQGHYHIGHLEPGTYYLAVSARPWYAQNSRGIGVPETYDGNVKQYSLRSRPAEDATLDVTYPLTFYSGALDSADATPLQLTPGERATADISLRATPSVHLRVHTGAAESPALGRMIFPHVSQRIFEGYVDSVTNAPDSWVAPGVIEISGLAPGHYIIEVPAGSEANGKANNRNWYRDIDLTSDTDINVSDAPGFVNVTGTILFPSHVPQHVSVQLANSVTGESFHSDIDQRGEFDFKSDNVRPGKYVIALEAAGGYTLEKLAATGAKITGRSVEIGNNASVRISGIATHGAGQVTGTAMREGERFSGAMIVLVPQDPGNNLPLFRRDQSDSDGTFTLANVVPGQYSVLAIANGWDLEWANPAVLQPYLKNADTVQVPSGGKLDVKVQVQ
jgi:5-hydroxyisourate hydrolase-like protein (transthyretin family)